MITIKILHICSYYYGTKLYKNFMDKLRNNKLDFKVYAPCNYNNMYNGKEEYLIRVKCFNNIDRLFFYHKYNKVYNKLINEVDVTQYNMTHAHSLFSNGYISYKLFKKYNIPYVVAIRNTDINVFFKYFLHLRKLGIKILENASKIIFISNSYKSKLICKYVPKKKRNIIEKKCVVLPNGIDDYFLKTTGEVRDLNQNKLNLVYTGRIDNNKNLITTVKCCDRVLKNNYNIELTVIGKITSKRYKKIIDKYEFINYLGEKNKKEIVKIYKNMDIFVMPSKHETFGLTYVEAMSQGLPVIYTKDEGFDKFFEDGLVGYPIRYNDYTEMANKIDSIVKNYKKMRENCIKYCLNFDWELISLKYIQLYKDIT